jgi:hypothetical protein
MNLLPLTKCSKEDFIQRLSQKEHFVPTSNQLLDEDALSKLVCHLAHLGQVENLGLALSHVGDVRVKRSSVALIRGKAAQSRQLLAVLGVLDSGHLQNRAIGILKLPPLVVIVGLKPVEELDKPLENNGTHLLDKSLRLEGFTGDIKREVVGCSPGQQEGISYEGGGYRPSTTTLIQLAHLGRECSPMSEVINVRLTKSLMSFCFHSIGFSQYASGLDAASVRTASGLDGGRGTHSFSGR